MPARAKQPAGPEPPAEAPLPCRGRASRGGRWVMSGEDEFLALGLSIFATSRPHHGGETQTSSMFILQVRGLWLARRSLPTG